MLRKQLQAGFLNALAEDPIFLVKKNTYFKNIDALFSPIIKN
jgi:hypothetical protein